MILHRVVTKIRSNILVCHIGTEKQVILSTNVSHAPIFCAGQTLEILPTLMKLNICGRDACEVSDQYGKKD